MSDDLVLSRVTDIDDDGRVVLSGEEEQVAPASSDPAAVKKVLEVAQDERMAPGPVDVSDDEDADVDAEPEFFKPWQIEVDEKYEIFAGLFGDDVPARPVKGRDGDDSSPTSTVPAVFTSPKAKFPFLQRIFRKFRSSEPLTSKVRVDTEESYKAYTAKRAKPFIEALAQRVVDLENAFAAHVSDGHGGSLDEEGAPDVEAIAGDVARLRNEAAAGGTSVPLKLPPWADGKVKCWQDGDKIFCSIRVSTPEGSPRVITGATSYSRHIEDVLGYVETAKVDPLEAAGALPIIAQRIAGGTLASQLAAMKPDLMKKAQIADQTKPYIGKVESKSDSALSTIMCLMREAKKGCPEARSELAALAKEKDSAVIALLKEGAARLDGVKG